MNLFVTGWDTGADLAEQAWSSLRATARSYPQLDAATAWQHRAGPGFAASVHHSEAAAAPRRYVSRSDSEVVTYDGIPYARSDVDALDTHDAEALARRWDDLGEVLDGQFVVVRLRDDPPGLEIRTDPLGLEQVYWTRSGDGWVLSNSVRLLARLGDPGGLDRSALSLLIATGTVGGNHTWHEGIRTLTGGEHWRWRPEASEPERHRYYSLPRISRQRRRDDVEMAGLADDLARPLRTFADTLGEASVSLSAGRDSRLVIGLLLRHEIPASYFTLGPPDNVDARLSQQLAEAFGLEHEPRSADPVEVLDAWDTAVTRLVEQNDGLVSLRHLQTTVEQPDAIDRLRVILWGAASGVARGNWSSHRLYLGRPTAERAALHVADALVKSHGGLVRPEGVELARSHVIDLMGRIVDDGAHPFDAPAVFSVVERTHRWEYSVARMYAPTGGAFSPLATRAFVEAAFSFSPRARLGWRLHRRLIPAVHPDLAAFPYDKPWPSPLPGVGRVDAFVRKITGRFGRASEPSGGLGLDWRLHERMRWLEGKRAWLRELCLDQSDSPAWEVVDRATFEHLTSETADPQLQRRRVNALLDVATAFAYQAERSTEGT